MRQSFKDAIAQGKHTLHLGLSTKIGSLNFNKSKREEMRRTMSVFKTQRLSRLS